jgi:hypothetical protein
MLYFSFFAGIKKAHPKPMPAETTYTLVSPIGVSVWMIAKPYGPKKEIADTIKAKSLISQTHLSICVSLIALSQSSRTSIIVSLEK